MLRTLTEASAPPAHVVALGIVAINTLRVEHFEALPLAAAALNKFFGVEINAAARRDHLYFRARKDKIPDFSHCLSDETPDQECKRQSLHISRPNSGPWRNFIRRSSSFRFLDMSNLSSQHFAIALRCPGSFIFRKISFSSAVDNRFDSASRDAVRKDQGFVGVPSSPTELRIRSRAKVLDRKYCSSLLNLRIRPGYRRPTVSFPSIMQPSMANSRSRTISPQIAGLQRDSLDDDNNEVMRHSITDPCPVSKSWSAALGRMQGAARTQHPWVIPRAAIERSWLLEVTGRAPGLPRTTLPAAPAISSLFPEA